MVVGTAFLIPAAILEGGIPTLGSASPRAWIGIVYPAVFGSVAAFILLNLGVARTGAARASAFAFLVPIVGVLSSVWLLGERLAAFTAVGGAMVLLGLWLVQRRGHQATPLPAPAEAKPAAPTTAR